MSFLAAASTDLTVQHAGHDWPVRFSAPEGACKGLILALHGGGGDGPQFDEGAGWTKKAIAAGFAVAVPSGLPAQPGRQPEFRTNPRMWNSGQLPPGAPRARIDDLGFFQKLLETCEAKVGDVPVFLAGHSNGSGMAFRLAAAWPDRIRAIAGVSGQMPAEFGQQPKFGVPTLLFAGDADPITPWAGGQSRTPWGQKQNEAWLDAMARWSVWMGGPEKPIVAEDDADQTVYEFKGTDPRTLVRLVRLKGHGHAWPGAAKTAIDRAMGPNTSQLDATDAAIEWFQSRL